VLCLETNVKQGFSLIESPRGIKLYCSPPLRCNVQWIGGCYTPTPPLVIIKGPHLKLFETEGRFPTKTPGCIAQSILLRVGGLSFRAIRLFCFSYSYVASPPRKHLPIVTPLFPSRNNLAGLSTCFFLRDFARLLTSLDRTRVLFLLFRVLFFSFKSLATLLDTPFSSVLSGQDARESPPLGTFPKTPSSQSASPCFCSFSIPLRSRAWTLPGGRGSPF